MDQKKITDFIGGEWRKELADELWGKELAEKIVEKGKEIFPDPERLNWDGEGDKLEDENEASREPEHTND